MVDMPSISRAASGQHDEISFAKAFAANVRLTRAEMPVIRLEADDAQDSAISAGNQQ